MQKPRLIKGGEFTDERGTLQFVNDFQMDAIKRMYMIQHESTETIRAWQAHRKEQKWFYVIGGSFEIKIVAPDNWELPSRDLEVLTFTIASVDNTVLHIPGGYANGIRALEKGSKLLVFSDFNMEEAKEDNLKFDKDYWNGWS